MYGGKFAFQNRLGWLVVGRKFTIFALFYFVFEGKFQIQAPPPGPPLNPSKVFSDPLFCSPKNQVIPPKILRRSPSPHIFCASLVYLCLHFAFAFDRPRSHRVYTETYSGTAI